MARDESKEHACLRTIDYGAAARRTVAARRDRDLVLSTTVNITKTIVGAGVLALPFAVQQGGVGVGFGCLLGTGALSLCGFLAIGYCCASTGARTYGEVWTRTAGWRPQVVDLMLFWETILCCIGYVILTLDYLSVGLQGVLGVEADAALRARLALLVTGLCLIPLCLQPTFYSLRFTSLFGNLATLFAIGYVILEAAVVEGRHEAVQLTGLLGESRRGVLQATSVMTSAYISHYSAPVLLAEHGLRLIVPTLLRLDILALQCGELLVAAWDLVDLAGAVVVVLLPEVIKVCCDVGINLLVFHNIKSAENIGSPLRSRVLG